MEKKTPKSLGLFNQRDPRWSSVPLGTGGGYTLGSAGCLVTAVAGMLVGIFSVDTDPGRLNRWLCRNDGFVGGNRFAFGALAPMGLDGVVVDCSRVPAPVERVARVLAAGGGVLALVDFVPGGPVNQHWVRILELESEDALIHDPWLPSDAPYWLMPRYGHHTWDDPARTLFRLAFYHRDVPSLAEVALDFDVAGALTVARNAVQGDVCVIPLR